MKTFYLKLGTEVINSVKTLSIGSAIIYFSELKNLSESELLKIFKVTDE